MIRSKLCGREYSGLELHLTSCLKKYNITREQYNDIPDKTITEEGKVPENEFKDEPVEDKGISQKEIVANIFKDSIEKKDPKRPFREALADYGIDEKEFGNIMKFWQGEGKIPLDMKMDRKATKGREEAAKLSGNKDVNTHSLQIAESLVKEHGFEVVTVRGATANTLKTWVLRKK